jgi:PIN domain nuclease of toxin-antitoxin system
VILLDTCAIIWDALDPEKLSEAARQAINDADRSGKLLIADISLWEIVMLVKRSRLILIFSNPCSLTSSGSLMQKTA